MQGILQYSSQCVCSIVRDFTLGDSDDKEKGKRRICKGDVCSVDTNSYKSSALILRIEARHTKQFGCPAGFFLRVWVSKKEPRRPAG